MLGDKPTFSNVEQSCIESVKRVYPDWKIKIWKDEDCMDWIKESPFALYNFEHKLFAYVSDYLRCKILYEEGGLYMDIDVYAIKRIPDSYFERNFLAWDVYNVTTNNGTCFYAKEQKQRIFKEFCDVMGNLKCPVELRNGSGAANDMINDVLKKYGLDMSTPGYCDKNQDLGEILILNRIEFGGRGRDDEGSVAEDVEPYLIHTCSGSWTVPSYSRFVELYYAIISKETDMRKLKNKVKKVIDKGRFSTVFIFFLTYQTRFFDAELRQILAPRKGYYRTYFIPCGNERGKVLDYISHKCVDIKSCIDIMRERNV